MATFEGIPAKWEREFDGVEQFEAAVSILNAELLIRHRITAVLSVHKLTVSQWTIMTILHFSTNRELTVGTLAGQLGVHSSTITKAVDRLEPHGWVQRAPLDRRTDLVRLTDTGLVHLREVQNALAEANFGFQDLSARQLRAVVLALRPVNPRLGRQ